MNPPLDDDEDHQDEDLRSEEELPWSLDRPALTPDAVAALLRAQFPTLGAGRTETLGEGWSFESFLWTSDRDEVRFVFRFPKREEEIAGMLRERIALPAVADRLELKVPLPVWMGEPSESFPYPFVGYHPVFGRTVFELDSVDDREVLRMFDIVRTFHAIPVTDPRLQDLPDEAPDPEDLCEALEEHLEALGDRFPDWLAGLADERLWQVDYPPAFEGEPVLIHGDLFDDHLRFDEEGRAAAILDWTDLAIGDPAVDLAGLVTFFGLPRLRRVTREADDVDEGTWQRADFFARANVLLDVATLLRRGHDDAASLREEWVRTMMKRGDFAS